MHEFGIAQQMVSVALEQAQKNHAQRVTRLQIEMSRAADENQDSLLFYLDELTRGTPAEGAALEIKQVSGKAHCLSCGCAFESDEIPTPCPRCHSTRVVQQPVAEFKIVSIEIE